VFNGFQRITEKDGSFSEFLEPLKALDDEKAVEILNIQRGEYF
jgi:hypothetical protein